MNIDCLFLGKTNENYLEKGIADFHGRLKRYAHVRIKIVRERKGWMGDLARINTEGRDILDLVEPKSLIVALDRTGRQLDSDSLAAMLQLWQEQNRRTVSFIIGGALGLSQDVVSHADFVLSLSLLTFTHEMARLILLEQLYRAFTIIAGANYHK